MTHEMVCVKPARYVWYDNGEDYAGWIEKSPAEFERRETKPRPVEPNRPTPSKPDGYAEHMSGCWDDVPAWATERINFLERTIDLLEQRLAPKMQSKCPDVPEHSCQIVKHCYPYLCNCSCGHNEMWVSDEERTMIQEYRNKE